MAAGEELAVGTAAGEELPAGMASGDESGQDDDGEEVEDEDTDGEAVLLVLLVALLLGAEGWELLRVGEGEAVGRDGVGDGREVGVEPVGLGWGLGAVGLVERMGLVVGVLTAPPLEPPVPLLPPEVESRPDDVDPLTGEDGEPAAPGAPGRAPFRW